MKRNKEMLQKELQVKIDQAVQDYMEELRELELSETQELVQSFSFNMSALKLPDTKKVYEDEPVKNDNPTKKKRKPMSAQAKENIRQGKLRAKMAREAEAKGKK